MKKLLLLLFCATLLNKVFAGVSVHILNVATEKEAKDIPVSLAIMKNGNWEEVATGMTDSNGRILILDAEKVEIGLYKLTFKVEKFIKSISSNKSAFFPEIDIVFDAKNPNEHYHIPLSLSPFSYSTYKGSYPRKK